MDSSEDELSLVLTESLPVPSPNPPSEVFRALEADLCSHPRASRRVALVPQSPDGTLRSVHDVQDSVPSLANPIDFVVPLRNRFAILDPFEE